MVKNSLLMETLSLVILPPGVTMHASIIPPRLFVLEKVPVIVRLTRRSAFEQGYNNGASINKPEGLCTDFATLEGAAALKQCRQYADDQAKILYEDVSTGFEDDFRELLEDEQFKPAANDAEAARWHQRYVDLLDHAYHFNAREVRRVAAEAILAATVKAAADSGDESESED